MDFIMLQYFSGHVSPSEIAFKGHIRGYFLK